MKHSYTQRVISMGITKSSPRTFSTSQIKGLQYGLFFHVTLTPNRRITAIRNSKPPSPPPPQIKDEAARRAKTRHFPILDLGGRGGSKFSIYFVQDCRLGLKSECAVIFHQSFLSLLRITDEPLRERNSCLWLQSRSVLSSFGVVLMSCRVNVVRSALQYSACRI